MYKDKDDYEYEDFTNIDYYNEGDVFCPCCGDIKDIYDVFHTCCGDIYDVDDVRIVIDNMAAEIECTKCGCIFEVTAGMCFSAVCKKYRTDGKEGEIK